MPRNICCRWFTRNCGSWLAPGWRRSVPVRLCRRRPWSTMPMFDWSTQRTSNDGTAGATSLPPPPKPCGGSWSNGRTTEHAQARRRRAKDRYRTTVARGRRTVRRAARARRRPHGAGAQRPAGGPTGEAPVLRRFDPSAGGRGPGHYAARSRPAVDPGTGVVVSADGRQLRAATAKCPRRGRAGTLSSTQIKLQSGPGSLRRATTCGRRMVHFCDAGR